MKRLVYFAVDSNFLELLYYNLQWMRKVDDTDVCIIAPHGLRIRPPSNNVHVFCPHHFDLWFTAKLRIVEWPQFINYDTFIYLDADAFAVRSLKDVFQTIEASPAYIHAVMEKESTDGAQKFFRISSHDYADQRGYNFGTFGFMRSAHPLILEFLTFVDTNRLNAKIDQALFNEFFAGAKNIMRHSLQKYVYLYNKHGLYNMVNGIILEEACIVHFLGNYRSDRGAAEKYRAASRIIPLLVKHDRPNRLSVIQRKIVSWLQKRF